MPIDKSKTTAKKPPLCPYCWETIERPGFKSEKDCEPQYRYYYCPECNALLAIVPIIPSPGMDEDAINEIIGR